MKKNIIKTAVVGCGRVSRTAHYNAIEKNDELKLLAVCDVDKERADHWAAENHVKAYYCIEDLLENESLDLISINTPNGTHSELGIKAANKSINIIVEKPLDMTIKAGDALIKACADNNVNLFVILQNRYNKTNKLLKSCIEKGRFGKLVTCNVTVNWRRGMNYYTEDNGWRSKTALAGGVFTNQCIHYLDMMLWLIDSFPVSVFAKMGSVFPIEVEDHGVGIVKFKNDVIGSFVLTNHAYPDDMEGSITISGEKGMVKLGGKSMNKVVWWEFEDEQIEDSQIKEAESNPPTVYGFGHIEFYNRVTDFLLYGKNENMIINGKEGRRSLELMEGFYLSNKSGKEIKLPL